MILKVNGRGQGSKLDVFVWKSYKLGYRTPFYLTICMYWHCKSNIFLYFLVIEYQEIDFHTHFKVKVKGHMKRNHLTG
jgi:hypothetical protein